MGERILNRLRFSAEILIKRFTIRLLLNVEDSAVFARSEEEVH